MMAFIFWIWSWLQWESYKSSPVQRATLHWICSNRCISLSGLGYHLQHRFENFICGDSFYMYLDSKETLLSQFHLFLSRMALLYFTCFFVFVSDSIRMAGKSSGVLWLGGPSQRTPPSDTAPLQPLLISDQMVATQALCFLLVAVRARVPCLSTARVVSSSTPITLTLTLICASSWVLIRSPSHS